MQDNQTQNKGFTLIELITVMAIFSILTAVTIFNYGNFNNNIIMTNLAYEVALEIRQAQTYSLSVRASDADPGISGREQFENRFGTFLNLGTSNTNFIFFSDSDSGLNGQCDLDFNNPGTSCDVTACIEDSECRKINTLTRGITFYDLCASNKSNPVDLDDGECESSNTNSVNKLNITFARPNPDAIIIGDGNSYNSAGIILQSSGGSKRAVIVNNTGQISVEMINN